MAEVIRKVENLIRVVLENVCSIGRQKLSQSMLRQIPRILCHSDDFFGFVLSLRQRSVKSHKLVEFV